MIFLLFKVHAIFISFIKLKPKDFKNVILNTFSSVAIFTI